MDFSDVSCIRKDAEKKSCEDVTVKHYMLFKSANKPKNCVEMMTICRKSKQKIHCFIIMSHVSRN